MQVPTGKQIGLGKGKKELQKGKLYKWAEQNKMMKAGDKIPWQNTDKTAKLSSMMD